MRSLAVRRLLVPLSGLYFAVHILDIPTGSDAMLPYMLRCVPIALLLLLHGAAHSMDRDYCAPPRSY